MKHNYVLFFLLLLQFVSCKPDAQQVTTVTVSAAISLKGALEETKRLYAQHTSGTSIVYNFGGSGSLQQQIEHGAPVDVFISAGNKQVESLEQKGLLLPNTKRVLVRNRLVLIVPQNSTWIKDLNDLTSADVKKIAMGEPTSVPAGQYAQEWLTSLGIVERVLPKLIYTNDVKQVLTYVESMDVDAGFVYITDAKNSQAVRIVSIAAEQSHSPIAYPIAVLAGTKNPVQAYEYVMFLLSPEARSVFTKYGFMVDNE